MVGGIIWFIKDIIVMIVLIEFVVFNKWFVMDLVEEIRICLVFVLFNVCLMFFILVILFVGVDVLWVLI